MRDQIVVCFAFVLDLCIGVRYIIDYVVDILRI